MDDRPVIGAAALAFELSVSEKTVRRLYAAGKLPGAFKLGGDKSPIRMSAESLDKLLKREGNR